MSLVLIMLLIYYRTQRKLAQKECNPSPEYLIFGRKKYVLHKEYYEQCSCQCYLL